MMPSKSLERIYGCIYKKERIATVEENILPDTFVLKIWKPFPGLRKDIHIKNIPEFYFLVMQEDYPLGSIERISENINKKYKKGFHAVVGEISVTGETFPVIRIKNFEGKNIIKELQEHYLNEGFHFSKDKRSIATKGMIKVKKHFSLVEVKEGIYFDRTVEELGYIKIPCKLDWDRFEEMTRRINVNVALGNFDAAIGIFYHGKDAKNIIRIFNPIRSLENLLLIRKHYLKEIGNPEILNVKVN